jgi:hypothetical protein
MLVAMAFAFVAVTGCFGLGAVWGMTGVVSGMLLAYLTTIGLYTMFLCRDLGVSPAVSLTPLLRGLLLAVPFGAASRWVGDSHQPYGWAGLLSEMGAWFALYLVAWYAVVGVSDRLALQDLLKRLLRR